MTSAVVPRRRRPNASAEQLDELFRRQVHAAIRVAPIANIANTVNIVIISMLVIPSNDLVFRYCWMAASLIAATTSIRMWFVRGRGPVPTDVAESRRNYRALLIEVVTLSLLDTVFVLRMLPKVGSNGEVVVVATAAGVMAGGAIALSILRSIGLYWVVLHAIGLEVALLLMDGTGYQILALQVPIYTAVLCVGVAYISDSFELRSFAEFAARGQRQTLELLLDDFEGEARDWLWETSPDGTFSHVSERLSEVSGVGVAELQSMSLVDLMARLSDELTGGESAHAVRKSLAAGQPVRELVVRVVVRGEGRWWSISAKPTFSDRGAFLGWRGVGSDITEQRLHRDEMLRMARTDSLTGLANRRYFGDVLSERLSREGQQVYLGIVDLDNFKAVNDTLGHGVGDELLALAAQRLVTAAASRDFVARLGGDEFAIVVRGGLDRERGAAPFDRYLAALQAPFSVQGNRIEIGASIGWSYSGEGGPSADEMVMRADLALYDAKERRRGRASRFDASMGVRARRRVTLLSDLARAIERNEFRFHYQPQHQLSTGKIVSNEALLRWHHPTRGILRPDAFLEAAEESGLIVPIGELMLREAWTEAKSWNPDIRVAVNVSHVQLNAGGFIDKVFDTIEEVGIEPHRLEFEVTESGAVSRNALSILTELREMGARIAIDDFGTGYSSFGTLQNLPVDLLKVDRTFIAALMSEEPRRARAILKSIVDIARALGIQSVAEGVERGQQMRQIREVGFDLVQGFYIQVPTPSPRDFIHLIRDDGDDK